MVRRHQIRILSGGIDDVAARAFWDEKRPIGKGLLQALSIEALLGDGGRP